MSTALKNVIGIFEDYAQAESAVEDLEVVGITGHEVTLIPGANNDVRGRAYIDRSTKDLRKHESFGQKVENLLHPNRKEAPVESSWVHADGQPPMPKNDALDIEDAELTDRDPALGGPAVLVVRLANALLADEATSILNNNGAVDVYREDAAAGGATHDAPETSPAKAIAGPGTELGSSKATTGADDTDLQGRGQQYKSRTGSND